MLLPEMALKHILFETIFPMILPCEQQVDVLSLLLQVLFSAIYQTEESLKMKDTILMPTEILKTSQVRIVAL